MSPRRPILAGLAVLALALAGCGSDDNKSSSDSASASTSGTQQSTAPANTNGQDLTKKPTIKTPGGKPPTDLVVKDLVKGTGRTAVPGANATVDYVGVLYKNGKQFDASWDRGQPFTFNLGAGMVIPGWDRGVVGMKVGGRRELIIPADQAYGAQSPSPDIPANSALIFGIDLKNLQ
jgi:peptidylprolyl isomerase